jgi:hypothetical protein
MQACLMELAVDRSRAADPKEGRRESRAEIALKGAALRFLKTLRHMADHVVDSREEGLRIGEDGAAGLRMIHNRGGPALIQDPAEATEPEMPAAAFALDDPDVLPIEQLSRRVFQFCSGTTVARVGDEPLVAGVPPRLAVRVPREGF